jgi:putative Flp pilus-assembly TadE/G-like protein
MRRGRRERGQILPIVALALVALLGISAFAIDVGYAYYAKRQLQSATDAAALAGAQDLPTAATAIATATSYATANTPANLSGLTFTYTTSCTSKALTGIGCNAATNPNALTVTGKGSTNTWFAKIFGIGHFDVAAHANACSPCSASPVDVVVVIDRTGSMCDTKDTNGCIDLNNAKDGVHTLLSMLSPPYAQVGMIAFPPLVGAATPVCNSPPGTSTDYTAYDSTDRRYVDDTIGSDYRNSDGTPNPSSGLYLHTTMGDATKCVIADGYTSYSEALRRAKAELDAHGRANVPDVIVFLTDGEANIGSVYASDGHSYQDKVGAGIYGTPAFPDNSAYPPGNADDKQPCHTAENLATAYKAAGVTIYSIGYALGTNTPCTGGSYGPLIPAQTQIKKNGTVTQIAIPQHWCDRDSTASVTISGKTSVENTLCVHKADQVTESPTIYSDDTVQNIASAGAFYNKSTAGDLSTIFAAIATDIGSGSSRLVDDGY